MTPKHMKPSMIAFGLPLFIADRIGGYNNGDRVKGFWGQRGGGVEAGVQGERRVN